MKIKDLSKTQWIMIVVTTMVLLAIIFRERIFENKIAKAKMEIFNTILQDEPAEAKENIKNILDTLLNSK